MAADTPQQTTTIYLDGEPVQATAHGPLLNAIMQAGRLIETACGGKGVCHLCRVTIAPQSASLPPPNDIEQRALGNVLLAQGVRLSCQISVTVGLAVILPQFETRAERRARRLAARQHKDRK